MRRALIASAALLCACGDAAPPAAPDPEANPDPSEVLAVFEIENGADHIWIADPDASSITFSAVQEGEAFTGRFETFDSRINLDTDAPVGPVADAAITVTIPVSSVRTGDAERDEALPGRDWFDAENHPFATYMSDRIARLDDGSYRADGMLTLRGVSMPVTLDFDLEEAEGRAVATGRATLDRREFGVGSGAFDTDQWIAFPVGVTVDVVAVRADAPPR